MRIGTQKVLFDSGSFVLGIAPISGAVLTSSIVDCSDWNSATVFVSCSSVSPTSQIEARSFISPVVSGAFYAVTGSGEQEQSTVGLTDAFSFSIDLAGARRFYVEFEEVGDPTTATQVTGSTIISHERGMRETVISSSVSGLTNPMTTAGDMIFNNLSSEEDRIAIGNEADVLTVVGGVPAWQAPVPSSGSIDTSLQAAPDTGWTAAGTASIASGVATLTLGPSDTLARLYRTAPTSPNAPMLEVIARVRRTQAPDGTDHGVGIGLANAAFDAGYFMDARPDNGGQVRALYNEQGGWQLINAMNFISPGDLAASPGASSVWIRMVATPYWTAFYTDTGATLPTTWGRLGRLIRRDNAVIPSNGWMTTLVILAVRGAGTGTAIFEVDQIQWRSLLGAPVQ